MIEQRNEEIVDTIVQLIRELSPSPGIAPKENSDLVSDLGYHSLAMVELAFALEEKFDLEPIDQATAKEIHTVGDIINYVVGKVDAQQTLQEA